ncbi:MAG: hypothetical protein J07HQW1_01955 [Haloquadratum walsbyi J07HQW1]|uniref:CopG family transcriptional regulator n=1 Tax=Haloquadratum walsbyi J07HQW1 TaxID=1238424 RepID=U1PID6_9EURY|nr:MAG: hypothetical protein J07HQW1_01955 [Haloquadratum walsbyi J07HQW1]
MEKETASIKISSKTKQRIQEMADERNDTVDDMTEYLVQKGSSRTKSESESESRVKDTYR